MLSVLATLVLALGPTPSPQDPDLIRQVRDVLDQQCASFPKEQRAEWCQRIASALSLAPADRLVRLMDGLPQLAGYYESTISLYRELGSSLEGHDRRMAQGYEIFGDQIEIIVKRAATRTESAAQRAAVEEQIRAVVASARDLLKDRLVGPSAATFVDREMDRLESGLKSTLDLPYSAVMDSPLSAGDLERVLADARKAAHSFDRVMVDGKDLGNPKRLAELGVTRLVADMKAAVNTMGKLCYPERSVSVQREKAWIGEIKAAQAKDRQLNHDSVPPTSTPKEPSPEMTKVPPGPVENMSREPAAARSGNSETAEPGATDPVRPGEAGRGRYLMALLGLALLGVLTWVLLRPRHQ